MVARTLWLWLCVVWLTTWLTEAIINPTTTSVCDLGPCRCARGRLICDCSTSNVKEIILKNEMFEMYTFSSVSVANCGHVHVTSRALSGLPALQQFSATNIASLTLEEQAFSWWADSASGLLINITDSSIPEFPSYCFHGSLRQVYLTSVNVSHVRPFAFSAIDRAERIDFTAVHFADLEPQAFKKFSVDFLIINHSRFHVFPTRTMMDIEVLQEVLLYNTTADRIETAAFKIHDPRSFRIVQCKIDHVEEGAFHVHTRGDVSIHENRFARVEEDAFVGFTVDRRYFEQAGKQDLIFENNTLTNFESGALTFNTSGFNPRLDWIMIDQRCSCPSISSWAADLVYFSSNTLYRTHVPQVDTVIYCSNPGPTSIRDFQRLYCNVTKSNILVKVLVGVGVVITLVVIGLVVYCGVQRRAKRYINVPTSPSALRPAGYGKPHMLVVPEGKTYRETELHVIVEHAEAIVPTEYVKERPDKDDQ
uniref:Right handed beta helix domain-containing protein n=1 Tax=Graphocephala atropunctata TaxID=36148 RepID=A0A1B6MB45_9HEMI